MEIKQLPSCNIIFMDIISHRTNTDDTIYNDCLFRVSTQGQINMDEFTLEVEHDDGTFIYNVWIKDMFTIEDYVSPVSAFTHGQNLRRKSVIKKIYNYYRSQGFNILYAYTYSNGCCCYKKLNSALSPEEANVISNIHQDNYVRQLESLKYLSRIFPNHKVIKSDYIQHSYAGNYSHHGGRCLHYAMKIMEKGDIFHCFNPEIQSVQKCDITMFIRNLENIPTSDDEKTNITMTEDKYLTLDEVRTLTKNYITITDQKFYNKKIVIDTLILATSKRLGENSSLKVLPPHLLREIGRWF